MRMPDWLLVAIAALAVWRITHLIVREDGPWRVVAHVRATLGGSWAGHLMDCFKCLSLWVAAPFVLIVDASWSLWFVLWLALSGAAILLEEQIAGPLIIEEGQQDGLLRRPSGNHGDEPL
jgi:hypothetical protein